MRRGAHRRVNGWGLYIVGSNHASVTNSEKQFLCQTHARGTSATAKVAALPMANTDFGVTLGAGHGHRTGEGDDYSTDADATHTKIDDAFGIGGD